MNAKMTKAKAAKAAKTKNKSGTPPGGTGATAAALVRSRRGVQFVFVTATLPQAVRLQLREEFADLRTVTGPGLHKVSPLMKLSVVDCSPQDSSMEQYGSDGHSGVLEPGNGPGERASTSVSLIDATRGDKRGREERRQKWNADFDFGFDDYDDDDEGEENGRRGGRRETRNK